MKNNSTLSRKPSNDMKKNAGLVKPVRRSDQSGDGADFAFNGQMGDGVNRMSDNGRCRNPYTIGDRADKQNVGQGPRKGNESSSSIMGGKSPNLTIATAAQGHNLGTGFSCPAVGNADKIYLGLGPRKGNE
jgi:hypothetical protein